MGLRFRRYALSDGAALLAGLADAGAGRSGGRHLLDGGADRRAALSPDPAAAGCRRMTPILLTPGPLTTREETRAAMLKDWGSRDGDFIALTAEVRTRLLAVANAAATHVAVP